MKNNLNDNLDAMIIKRISEYITDNNLSITKIAVEAEMTYQQLWCILKKNSSIKVREYIALCNAFHEPFTKFLD